MNRSHVLFVALAGGLVAVSLVPYARAASQSVTLSPGDSATVNCSTTLTGSVASNQANLSCAPAPTPTPTPTSGIPRCSDHTPTMYHGLVKYNVDGSINCTYGHTHMDNPHVLDAVLGPLPSYLGGEISYAWQTYNSQTGALENDAKHRVYDWMVVQNQTCVAGPSADYSLSNGRWEVHADGNMGATVRYHSYFFQGELCDPDDALYHGHLSVGGWIDFGHLEAPDLNYVRLPGDPAPGTEDQLRRLHGSPSQPRYEMQWYGAVTTPTRDGNANYVQIQGGINKADWGPVDPNNPFGPMLFYGNGHIGGSTMIPFDLWSVYLPAWLPGNVNGRITYHGFTNRYGQIVPSCSPVGLDCIPLVLDDVKPGWYIYRSTEHSEERRNYNILVNGQSLIEFPN